jgi:hypothetical protein
MKQLAIGKLTAEINKDQSIAEMNNAKAGSTSATAAYDLGDGAEPACQERY